MATAVYNSNYALNLTNFNISNLLSGTITQATNSQVTVTLGTETVGFGGSFAYSSPGVLAYGTITSITDTVSGTQLYSITGLDVSASSFLSWTYSRNNTAALNAVFGGNDTIQTGEYADYMRGFAGNDYMLMLGGADLGYGDEGNDFIAGNAGSDTLVGGTGNDTLWGGRDEDLLYGQDDADELNGNLGNDTLYGGAGNDVVWGGQGNDWVFGDAGNEWVAGNYGADLLTGGSGSDTFEYRTGWGNDAIVDFSSSEGDRILLTQGMTYTVNTVSGWAQLDFGNGDTILLVNVAPAAVSSAWFVYG